LNPELWICSQGLSPLHHRDGSFEECAKEKSVLVIKHKLLIARMECGREVPHILTFERKVEIWLIVL
jgi:hypothetical protein